MELLQGPGLYIVTLRNTHPISVNAQDPRVADRAIKVTHVNCKVGKAKVLAARQRNYQKTFGAENVSFHAIASLADVAVAERAVLRRLAVYRIRGLSGWPTEWLENISPREAHALVVSVLAEIGIEHELIPNVFSELDPEGSGDDASPRSPVHAEPAPTSLRIYASYCDWVQAAAIPMLAESADAMRLDRRSAGGNREVCGRFRFAGRVWRVHGDTHFEPVFTAYWAMRREHSEAALEVRRTRSGECLELRDDLQVAGTPKRFYVYGE